MSSLKDILELLLEPKQAKAEVIPMDEEAKAALRQATQDQRFAPVIARAHESPRKVQVYAGNKAHWLDRTNALGLHLAPTGSPEKLSEYRSELYRRGFPGGMLGDATLSQVWIRPEIPPQEAQPDNYHTPNALDADPMRRKAGTLTHELGHFLAPSQGEVTADIIATNPASFEQHFAANPKIFDKMPGTYTDDWYRRTKEKETREALGDRSRAFTGPPRAMPIFPWDQPSLAESLSPPGTRKRKR